MGKQNARNNNRKDSKSYRKSGNNKSKGYKKIPEYKEGASRTGKFDPTIEGSNDFAWYNQNPVLARAAANLAYANVLGLPIVLGDNGESASGLGVTIPGILILKYAPGIGLSKDDASAVNVNARQIYAEVRKANSGARNYESADLMMYLLAMASNYQFYSELVRVYGLFNVYSPDNRYLVKPMVKALGFDYDDLAHHLPNLRFYINHYATQLNKFYVPRDMTFYDRGAFMTTNIYRDSNTHKPQLYAFVPEYYYKWDPTTATGSALRAMSRKNTMTFADIVDVGSELITELLTDTDIGLMSGDIAKAFPNLRNVIGIDDAHATVPVYNESMLSQIHNATVVGSAVVNTCDITQSNGFIRFEPRFLSFMEPSQTQTSVELIQIIDSGMDEPDVAFNMESTRLKTAIAQTIDVDGHVVLQACGTEVVTQAIMYNLSGGSLDGATLMRNSVSYDDTGTSYGVTQRMYSWREFFDWHPLTYHFHFDSRENPAHVQVYPEGDLFNYAVLPNSTLEKMHIAALLSMFQVPSSAQAV